jgi:hypothetical protein
MSDLITTIDPLQDARWDEFVENHPFGWLCHLSGWKNVLEKSFKHMHGHYIILLRDGVVQAGLPLFEVRSWILGNRLVSIPFATLCDPLVSTREEMDKLFTRALDLSKDLGISSIEIRAMLSEPYVLDDRLSSSHFFKHHFIPLNRPPEVLNKSFHRTCVRQRITRASQSGIEISQGETESDIDAFYELHIMSRKRLGLPPQPREFIHAIWDTFYPQQRVSLLFAKKDGLLIGSLMLFKYKSRVSAEFAVWNEEYIKISPMHGLFWEAIQAAYREGFTMFDFGRTSPDNHTLMDFKNRWGTQVIDLPNFYYPKNKPDGTVTSETFIGRKVVREVCRVAPRPIFEGVGKFLYKHLG